MSTDLKRRNIPFSPPDMTEAEANEVPDAILSWWITTGPRTKKLEKLVACYVGVNDSMDVQTPNCVCLNSQTACAEMALRILGIGKGDEVIVHCLDRSLAEGMENSSFVKMLEHMERIGETNGNL